MSDLKTYFTQNTGRLIDKWDHYFEIYERHFARFRGTAVHVVEFGVSQGGSLQMWKHYFGPQAKIYGVDINPHCLSLAEDQIEIFIGDQEDRSFLRSLHAKIPRIDILIDDGGHYMRQQINTFREMFPRVDERGVYLCEDLHTSYWPEFGGGYRRRGTYIEFSKRLIDGLNAWHTLQPRRFNVTDFTRSVHSMHYYDSVLVIEKRPLEKPFHTRIGTPSIPDYRLPKLVQRLKNQLTCRLHNLRIRLADRAR